MQPVVEAKSIYKTYIDNEREVVILNGLNCMFKKGEIVAIMGASGVGKTTLIHVLSSLDAPNSGIVRLLGVDINALSQKGLSDFRNKHIGFVFQMHHLLSEFSAFENACMHYYIGGQKPKEASVFIKDLFSMLGLSDKINSPIYKLSGGERERVAIIRAMAKRPELLFADEPTGNLDERSSEKVAELFKVLNARFGTTIIFVTHNTGLASIADRVFTLTNGIVKETNL